MTAAPSAVTRQFDVTEAQARFIQSPARIAMFVGGVGAGKTFAGALRAMWQVFWPPEPRWESSTGLVVAPTYRMLVDVVEPVCLSLWEPTVVRRAEHIVKVGQHTVLFRSADRPDRLRGLNVSWVWIDEAAFVREDVYRVILGRLREQGREGLLWLTSTPRGKSNWLYRVAMSGAAEVIHASTRDNPFLSEGFIKGLEDEYPGQLRAQEVEGQFVDLGESLIDVTNVQWTEFDEDDVTAAVRYWDLAVSTKSSADYTASVRLVKLRDGTFVLTAPIRRKVSYPELRELIITTGLVEVGTEVHIEANAFQLAAVQDLLADGRLAVVKPVVVDRDKVSRASPWIVRLANGVLKLDSRYDWRAWLAEWSMFPGGPHDDTVDAVSGAWAALTKPRRKLEVW